MKKILMIVGGVIGLLLIVAFVLPTDVHVKRSISINASKSVIQSQINELPNWKKWSAWDKIDTAMLSSYEGPKSGAGAIHKWSSNNPDVGNGTLSIISSTADSIKTALTFEGMPPGNGLFVFFEEGDSTLVTWSMDSDLGLEMGFLALMFDGMLGPQFETSLSSLKEVCESAPSYELVQVNKEEFAGMMYISQSLEVEAGQMDSLMGAAFQALAMDIVKHKGIIDGAPFTIYYGEEEGKLSIEACFPVQNKVQVSKEFELKKMTKATVLSGVHKGSYQYLGDSHAKMRAEVAARGLEMQGPFFEQYMTNPNKVTNEMKWVTKLFYPIK